MAGQSVTVLECIFEHLQQPYRIQLTSVSRARQNVSRHIADGFFSSAPDSQVDGYAQLSAPLLMEKWYWYAQDPLILNKPIWDRELRIGSVRGSNSMTWLEARGIAVAQKVPCLEQLIELLQRGRIDLFLADDNAMRSALSEQPSQQGLQRRFVRSSPLGVYFSHDFLQHHPDFLSAFNRQVEHCAPKGSALTEAEAHYLRQLTAQHLKRWAYHDELLNALHSLDQCFALATGPFATHVLFDGEYAGRVIEFFADVLADALQLAAAGTLDVLRLMTNHGARKLCRQHCALGLLAGVGWSSRGIDGFQLRLDGGNVSVEQVIQQAVLVRAQLLATLGKFMPFVPGDFVCELLKDGLIAVDLLAHHVDLRQ